MDTTPPRDMTPRYRVLPLDGLFYVVDVRYPSVLTALPYVTEAEAAANAEDRTQDYARGRHDYHHSGPYPDLS